MTPSLGSYIGGCLAVIGIVSAVGLGGYWLRRWIVPEFSGALARLADAYTRFFYRYEEAPLLIVNSERLNFVDDPDHFDLLRARIGAMRSQREFFNLGEAA